MKDANQNKSETFAIDSDDNPTSPLKLLRNRVGAIINNNTIQNLIVLFIVVNSIMMGVATFDFVRLNPTANSMFEWADYIFLIIFTMETAMQLFYHGFGLLKDGWLVFDFVIIVMSWSFQGVQIIRAFRIFRALRLVSRVKVMRDIVTALISVVPRMIYIGILLMIINYIFSVMFTTLFKNAWPEYTSHDYFSTLELSAFTLFQVMTLDSWAKMCREVQLLHSWAWVPFLIYVIISAFVVVNLVIAVVCDAISELHVQEEKEKKGGKDQELENPGIPELINQIKDMQQTILILETSQELTKNMLMDMTKELKATKSLGSDCSVATHTSSN